jgi:hypothetical protein
LPCWGASRETPIFRKIALVAVFVLSSTMAFAQPSQGMMGSDNGPTSNAPTTSGSMNQDAAAGTKMKKSKTAKMKKSTTGSSKDASTQGAGTAGAAQKKGDATTPGGTMKQQ